ncbi:MAG: NfeD family protein [Acidobacteria bacterium]|nr:NfeD family protein [Acidobacteriota bacterium]
MLWWYWVVFGLVLVAVELATPGGFFVIFFAIAAIVVGSLELLGVLELAWLQWLLFTVIALAGLALFRKPLVERLGPRGSAEMDTLVGEIAVPASAIPPGEHGRAELRGAGWSVRNVDTTTLAAGQRCRVVAVQGLMLDLRQE